MLRYQAGEAAAFDELIARNTQRVHAIVSRFILDPIMVEDLTQEVFLRVFRASKRYKPTARFSTFLYRIAANLSFNALRARKNSPTVPLDGYSTSQDEDYQRQIPDYRQEAPGHGLSQHEMNDLLAQAVNDLPENQRIAIILNKYEGSSYRDIAYVLKCSPMAVKSLLSRARTSLRDSLKKYMSH
ncbi:MAG: sigma-70 family RNA polymerase sigma factor [Planctomycetaceae bacterium]|nr:sigma-70 family RNA polymerase sigma factor [Planctomycetaceae bacterium]